MAVIYNFSHADVWITADNSRFLLPASKTSADLEIYDADGLLLDGRSVFFDSWRTSLGGGKVHTKGAIKVCSVGQMWIEDAIKPLHLKVRLDVDGYIHRVWKDAEQAGYKDEAWCKAHDGWDFATARIGYKAGEKALHALGAAGR